MRQLASVVMTILGLVSSTGFGAHSPIPASLARFVAAYASGDEAAIRPDASSLYWLEQDRIGQASGAARAAVHPPIKSIVLGDGQRDTAGYGHWLGYTSVATAGGAPIRTIWRVDTDAADRVIWIEPVYELSGCAADPEVNAGRRALPLPADLGGESGETVLGLRCPTSDEGYYIVQSPRRPGIYGYVAVQADRAITPGAWSFGTDDFGQPAAGNPGPGMFAATFLFKGPGADRYPAYAATLDPAYFSPPGS